MSSKRSVLTVGLLGSAVLLISGSQTWVHGTVGDAVLGRMPAHGTGSQVAPAAVAAGLVAGAGAVASATSGPLVRRVAAFSMLLAAALSAALAVQVAVAPGAALARASATALGQRDTLHAVGQAGPWLWVAAAGTALVALAGVGAVLGTGRWRPLPSRYDAPAGPAPAGPAPAEPAPAGPAPAGPGAADRPQTTWDRLSRGDDPTLRATDPDPG